MAVECWLQSPWIPKLPVIPDAEGETLLTPCTTHEFAARMQEADYRSRHLARDRNTELINIM